MSSQKNNFFIIFIIIISLLILFSGVRLCFFLHGLNSAKHPVQVPFDSTEWKTMDETERYKMYDDLVKNYATIGKTYDEIIDLLGDSGGIYDPDGKPDNKNYYLHYTIRYDDWNGYEVILLHFKDDALIKVEKELLAYL